MRFDCLNDGNSWVEGLTAHLVDGGRLGRVGHAGTEHDLTSGGLTGASLEDLTKVEVLDLSGLDAGLGEDALDGGDAELDGGSLLKSTLERSDGRAGLYDGQQDGIERREGMGLGQLLPSRVAAGWWRARAGEAVGRTAPTMKTSRRPLGVDEDACMVVYESQREERGRTKGSNDTTRGAENWAKTSDATFNANTKKSAGGRRPRLSVAAPRERGGKARSPF